MTLDEIPFAKLLGIEAESVEPGHAVLSMKIRDDLLRNGGIAHGGAIATLIDSAMAFAIVPLLSENERTTTVDLTIHYLRPLTEGTARASARVVRAGQKSHHSFGGAFRFTRETRRHAAISTYLRLSV